MRLPSLRRAPLLLALLPLLPAAGAHGEDLLQVYHLAAERDPQFRGEQANLAATRELKPQTRAQLMLPQVTVGAQTAEQWQGVHYASGSGFVPSGDFAYNSRGYSLDVTQPVFHYDRYIQYQQADDRIRQAQLRVDAARQDLIVRIAERYFGVLAARDTLEFATAEKAALARQLDQSQQRFNVGLIPITDVQEAKASHDLAVASEIDAEKQLDDARQALREFAGEIADDLPALSDNLPLVPPAPADLRQWTQASLKQNLNLKAAEAASAVAGREIDNQRAGHYPTLDIVGSRAESSQGGQFGANDTDLSGLGVRLSLPIYEGGIVQSRTREALHRHEAALEQEEQTRRAVQRLSHDAYTGVISGISRVNALKQAIVSTDTALAATRAGFEVGTRTTVDVVTQERDTYRAKRDYARARYDYVLSTLRLKSAAGTLSPDDLNEVNRWLKH